MRTTKIRTLTFAALAAIGLPLAALAHEILSQDVLAQTVSEFSGGGSE